MIDLYSSLNLSVQKIIEVVYMLLIKKEQNEILQEHIINETIIKVDSDIMFRFK